jgi:hypothetical protein
MATGYFRAISMDEDIAIRLFDHRALDELVHALETARSRLAVAVAADSKVTTLSQRKHYLETDARLRRCLRKLRARQRPGRSGHLIWTECLESLGLLLAEGACRGRSHRMCACLDEILSRLEDGRDGPSRVSLR